MPKRSRLCDSTVCGSNVWIEFVCQNGIVIQSHIRYHTIWRDRVTDYNAAYGF